MTTIYQVLAILAALAILIAVPLLTLRAILLMDRMEETRKAVMQMIAESSQTLLHAGHVLDRSREELDRLRHATEGIERIVSLLQPAATLGGWLHGARRAFSRPSKDDPGSQSET